MSVLVFAETSKGKFKKPALEAVSYGKKIAAQLETNLIALAIRFLTTVEISIRSKLNNMPLLTWLIIDMFFLLAIFFNKSMFFSIARPIS